MSDDLRKLKDRHKRLHAEIVRIGAGGNTPARKLKLLLLKKDLEEVTREMRAQQKETGAKMSRSTAASQAAGAYARMANAWKSQGR